MTKMNKKIAIIDYGVGNLYSVKKALDKFSGNVFITEEPEKLLSADAIILPGVGSFQAGIEGLRIRNLIQPVKKFASTGKPILGICLGAQLLLSKGYEFGTFNGLGIIPEKVIFCKKCVISNQRPSSTVEFKHTKNDKKETIAFREDGVCDACRYTEYKDRGINWKTREKELIKLCDKYKGKNGYYDCIVPGSGGKDSSYTAHILKYKYGMNPLTVTW